MKRFWLVLVPIALAGCVAKPRVIPGTQSAATLTKKITREIDYKYLIYLPLDYAREPERTWPIVVFLHGSGERGSDVGRVASHGPPKLVAAGQKYDFVLVSPLCPPDRYWQIDDLQVLLDEVLKQYRVDRQRMYLTGLSMGGVGTWDWIIRYPDEFAAAVPICGWSDSDNATRASKTPVWAFHGAKDPVIPVEESRSMVAKIEKTGGEAKLTIYPDAGHNSWSATYDNPEMWKWLLGHRRVQ